MAAAESPDIWRAPALPSPPSHFIAPREQEGISDVQQGQVDGLFPVGITVQVQLQTSFAVTHSGIRTILAASGGRSPDGIAYTMGDAWVALHTAGPEPGVGVDDLTADLPPLYEWPTPGLASPYALTAPQAVALLPEALALQFAQRARFASGDLVLTRQGLLLTVLISAAQAGVSLIEHRGGGQLEDVVRARTTLIPVLETLLAATVECLYVVTSRRLGFQEDSSGGGAVPSIWASMVTGMALMSVEQEEQDRMHALVPAEIEAVRAVAGPLAHAMQIVLSRTVLYTGVVSLGFPPLEAAAQDQSLWLSKTKLLHFPAHSASACMCSWYHGAASALHRLASRPDPSSSCAGPLLEALAGLSGWVASAARQAVRRGALGSTRVRAWSRHEASYLYALAGTGEPGDAIIMAMQGINPPEPGGVPVDGHVVRSHSGTVCVQVSVQSPALPVRHALSPTRSVDPRAKALAQIEMDVTADLAGCVPDELFADGLFAEGGTVDAGVESRLLHCVISLLPNQDGGDGALAMGHALVLVLRLATRAIAAAVVLPRTHPAGPVLVRVALTAVARLFPCGAALIPGMMWVRAVGRLWGWATLATQRVHVAKVSGWARVATAGLAVPAPSVLRPVESRQVLQHDGGPPPLVDGVVQADLAAGSGLLDSDAFRTSLARHQTSAVVESKNEVENNGLAVPWGACGFVRTTQSVGDRPAQQLEAWAVALVSVVDGAHTLEPSWACAHGVVLATLARLLRCDGDAAFPTVLYPGLVALECQPEWIVSELIFRDAHEEEEAVAAAVSEDEDETKQDVAFATAAVAAASAVVRVTGVLQYALAQQIIPLALAHVSSPPGSIELLAALAHAYGPALPAGLRSKVLVPAIMPALAMTPSSAVGWAWPSLVVVRSALLALMGQDAETMVREWLCSTAAVNLGAAGCIQACLVSVAVDAALPFFTSLAALADVQDQPVAMVLAALGGPVRGGAVAQIVHEARKCGRVEWGCGTTSDVYSSLRGRDMALLEQLRKTPVPRLPSDPSGTALCCCAVSCGCSSVEDSPPRLDTLSP